MGETNENNTEVKEANTKILTELVNLKLSCKLSLLIDRLYTRKSGFGFDRRSLRLANFAANLENVDYQFLPVART